MNFAEATTKLKEGHAIRRKSWPEFIHLKLIRIANELDDCDVIKGYRQESIAFVYDTSIILSDEWEVLGTDNIVDFPVAVEMLRKRFKIKLKEWDKNTFLDLHPNGKELFMRKMCEYDYVPTFECFSAYDWEVME